MKDGNGNNRRWWMATAMTMMRIQYFTMMEAMNENDDYVNKKMKIAVMIDGNSYDGCIISRGGMQLIASIAILQLIAILNCTSRVCNYS